MTKFFRIFFLMVIIIFITISAKAESIYVAQTARGTDTGGDVNNAHSMSWLNNSSNWGAGVGQIGPGDTVHLCGLLTTSLTVGGSGSGIESPITIRFEDDAKFSASHWGSPGQAIAVLNRSYVIIDGGKNGLIEATDNGTAKTYQDYDTRGVFLSGVNGCEVKNIFINNIFVRSPRSNGAFGGNGVRIEGASNTKIYNIKVNYSNSAVYYAYGNDSNVSIRNITHNHGANGIVVGNRGDSNLNGITIYNNTINLYNDASDSSCTNLFHNDGIQIFAQSQNSSIRNLRIYNNTVGPEMGECTATTGWIFLEGYVFNPIIYNNLLLLRTGVKAPTNGFIYDKANSEMSRGSEIYNNTIISSGKVGTGINASEDGSTIINNILMNLNYGIYGNGFALADYNCYFNNGTNGHTDSHGVTTDPSLDLSYRPDSVSDSVVNTGLNLSSKFTEDKNETIRTGNWSIGAFQFGSGMSPPAGLRVIN